MYLEAISIVGPVPKLNPHKIILFKGYFRLMQANASTFSKS